MNCKWPAPLQCTSLHATPPTPPSSLHWHQQNQPSTSTRTLSHFHTYLQIDTRIWCFTNNLLYLLHWHGKCNRVGFYFVLCLFVLSFFFFFWLLCFSGFCAVKVKIQALRRSVDRSFARSQWHKRDAYETCFGNVMATRNRREWFYTVAEQNIMPLYNYIACKRTTYMHTYIHYII